MSDFTVETVQTAVGICHKVMPVKACLYVDNAHIDRWQGSKTAMEAFAVAKLFAAAPDLLEACEMQEDAHLMARAARDNDSDAYQRIMIKWFGDSAAYTAPELGMPRFDALRREKRRAAIKKATQ